MNNLPLVSVCIPSYNHAQYLPYCLESVLAQTYPNIEIIIVDDGSKDDSLSIAQNYANKYPGKVVVYTHPNRENRGISNTVNYALSLAKGKYWCGLCSDDAMYPDKTSKQVAYLEANAEYQLVYSYGDYIGSHGEKIPGKFGKNVTQEPDPIEILLRGNVIPGMTILAHRTAMENVGPHEPDLVYSDWDFWLRCFAIYKVGFIPESLVEYRIHSYNTSVNINELTGYDNFEKLYLKLGRDSENPDSFLHNKKYRDIINKGIKNFPRGKALAHLENYFTEIDNGRTTSAISHLRNALKLSMITVFKPRRILAIAKHGILRGKRF